MNISTEDREAMARTMVGDLHRMFEALSVFMEAMRRGNSNPVPMEASALLVFAQSIVNAKAALGSASPNYFAALALYAVAQQKGFNIPRSSAERGKADLSKEMRDVLEALGMLMMKGEKHAGTNERGKPE